jgi:hypothetical protein
VSAITLEILLWQIPNDYTLKRKYLDKNASEIETLILGNSHAYYAINPQYFTVPTFNSAMRSQSLDFDYEIFKKYKDNFTSLKTIVLTISYPSLWGRLSSKTGASYIINNYKMFYGFNSPSHVPFHLEIFNRPLEVNIRRIKKYYIEKRSPQFSDKAGWGRKDFEKIKYTLPESGKLGANQQTFDDINSLNFKRIYEDNINILTNILKWSNQNGVQVILLTTPAHESYRKSLNPKQLNKTIETAKMLASKHENCRYYNFLDDPRFTPEDFRDAHHLSIKGAHKFSEIFAKEIGYFKEVTISY